MFLLIGAFIAGVLTVLAPCVLPLLPVIIGGSVSGDTKDKRRPLIIAASLAVSLIVFTLLLKVTTLFINIPPNAITYFSGGLIIAIGLATLFPSVYTRLTARLGFEHRAQKLLGTGTKNRNHIIGPIITGAALGPVFSSCSPIYGYILATVLPVHFAQAMAYIVSYVVGLALIMLVIGYYGQRFTSKLKFASNPKGLFQRGLAVVFIVVGVLIATGSIIRLQTYAAGHAPSYLKTLNEKLLPKSNKKLNDTELYNVESYKAPELVGIQQWLNSQPLTLAQLKGKVVLVDFWTYSCINCIRSLPYVQGWYSQYQKDGLVVIGVHAPEFSFEKVPANVDDAIHKYKLTYPVALDNNFTTWDAFRNQYWPAEYLIDRSGNVRRQHFGEGKYDETEKAIRGLLAEGSNQKLSGNLVAKPGGSDAVAAGQTPETYLGSARANNYNGTSEPGADSAMNFHFASNLATNQWSLSGTWQVAGDKITAKANSKLRLNFAAKNVYLVGGSASGSTIGVSLGGKPISASGSAGSDVTDSKVVFGQPRLYRLASFSQFTHGTLELSVPSGADLNVFTFGN